MDAPAALSAVRDRFGPEKVFSPTALEAYVSCPFRFLLEHVLRLEELDEPADEVEHTRRGAAYHRALARLHAKLREADPELTRASFPETVGPDLLIEIDKAIQEYADRAPSPASRKLWELEGKRLHRSAAKYGGHWEDFLGPWRKAGAALDPRLLEADFGLPSPTTQVQAAVRSDGSPPCDHRRRGRGPDRRPHRPGRRGRAGRRTRLLGDRLQDRPWRPTTRRPTWRGS